MEQEWTESGTGVEKGGKRVEQIYTQNVNNQPIKWYTPCYTGKNNNAAHLPCPHPVYYAVKSLHKLQIFISAKQAADLLK